VARKLRGLWSPEQIAGWTKYAYSDDENFQVSHETIYKSLFIQARGALKKEQLQHLRRTRTMRRGRGHTQKTATHGRITGTVSIRERPASVEDRAVPGHWEGDLIIGSNNSQIATLVERHTRYVMLVRVPSKDTKTVINALVKHAHKLPRELYKSLTWDRGKEMAARPQYRSQHRCPRQVHTKSQVREQSEIQGAAGLFEATRCVGIGQSSARFPERHIRKYGDHVAIRREYFSHRSFRAIGFSEPVK
jgi:IS30 family transposase